MKTEELTAGGIRKIDAVNTIEKLKKEILLSLQYIFNDEDIANFKDAIMKYNDKNVLLFVDNLETLLRDNPQEFCELIDELPPCYRVIVSSRIPVDAAISYPLNQMTDIDAAILARNYARRRSIQYLQDKDFQYISNKLQNNPLAIRLCIDTLLSSGKKLNELLNDVSGDIAEYSYKNLIESISENSVEILELLFLQKSLTREEIAELLGKNIDDIATSIAQLRKTSLLLSSQLDSEEIYYINEGIRNFLMLSERNLKIREQIYNKLRKNQAILNEINNRRKETHKNNMWFIPGNLPKELQKIIFSISKQSRKKDNFAEIKKLFNLLTVNEHMYEKYDIYWRMKAHLLSKLKDIYQAEECINKALSMDEESFINNYQLVKFYFYSRQDYVASEYLLKKIIEKLDSYELDNYLIREVYSYFYLSELYQNKYDTIIEQTKDWKDRPIIRGVLGSIRARALKRIAEQKNGIEKFNLLYRAIRIITDTINQDGELKMTKSTISEIVEHLNSITNNKYISLLTEKQKNAFDLFLDRFDTSLKTDNISSKNNTCENIISNFLFENTINQKITEGYINTFIYKIPDVRWGYTQYIFSKDENDNEYFIHFDNCKDIEWDDWKKLKIGDEVVVKAHKILNPQNKARPIEDAIFF